MRRYVECLRGETTSLCLRGLSIFSVPQSHTHLRQFQPQGSPAGCETKQRSGSTTAPPRRTAAAPPDRSEAGMHFQCHFPTPKSKPQGKKDMTATRCARKRAAGSFFVLYFGSPANRRPGDPGDRANSARRLVGGGPGRPLSPTDSRRVPRKVEHMHDVEHGGPARRRYLSKHQRCAPR